MVEFSCTVEEFQVLLFNTNNYSGQSGLGSNGNKRVLHIP